MTGDMPIATVDAWPAGGGWESHTIEVVLTLDGVKARLALTDDDLAVLERFRGCMFEDGWLYRSAEFDDNTPFDDAGELYEYLTTSPAAVLAVAERPARDRFQGQPDRCGDGRTLGRGRREGRTGGAGCVHLLRRVDGHHRGGTD